MGEGGGAAKYQLYTYCVEGSRENYHSIKGWWDGKLCGTGSSVGGRSGTGSSVGGRSGTGSSEGGRMQKCAMSVLLCNVNLYLH